MKKGISLITLIITIIVVIILATIILLNLFSNNIINEADKAVLLNDLDSFKHELQLFTLEEMLADNSSYDLETLQANASSVYFEGLIDPDGRNIYDIIPSLSENTRYGEDDIIIEDGKVIYVGSEDNIINTYPEENVKTSEPEINISNIKSVNRYKSDEIIQFLVTITDENEVAMVDFSNKVSILNSNGDTLYTYESDEITSTENILNINEREETISIAANSLLIDGIYNIVVDSDVAENKYGRSNTVGKSFEFELDSTPPITPSIDLSTNSATNGDITVTITYPADAVTKEYSTDGGITWETYTGPFVISSNVTIIARAIDDIGNISTVANKTVTNIDKTPPSIPTISQSPTGATNGNVTITVTYSSDSVTKQYKIGTGLWQTYNSTFTVSSNTTIYARSYDEAGNESDTANRSITNIDKIVPSGTFDLNSSSTIVSSRTITFNPSDSGGSGVYRWQYRISTDNGSTYGDYSAYVYGDITDSILLNSTGENKIHVQVFDNAGNYKNIYSGTYLIMGPLQVGQIALKNAVIGRTDTVGASYNNPVIPKGFKAINTNTNWSSRSSHWDDGLVIEDAIGNQFVWIPVNGTSIKYTQDFVKYLGAWDNVTEAPIWEGTSSSGGINEHTQINNYKGFYMSRYEAGIDTMTTPTFSYQWSEDGSLKPVSKAGRTSWNRITYYGAVRVAKAMYNDTSKYGVYSSIPTGRQWDAMLDLLELRGYNTYSDSRYWGNYSDSTGNANISTHGSLQVTGHSGYWKAVNLYDIAGNLWCWTSSIDRTYRNIRGGAYSCSIANTHATAGYRGSSSPAGSSGDIGFRIVLYIY